MADFSWLTIGALTLLTELQGIAYSLLCTRHTSVGSSAKIAQRLLIFCKCAQTSLFDWRSRGQLAVVTYLCALPSLPKRTSKDLIFTVGSLAYKTFNVNILAVYNSLHDS